MGLFFILVTTNKTIKSKLRQNYKLKCFKTIQNIFYVKLSIFLYIFIYVYNFFISKL